MKPKKLKMEKLISEKTKVIITYRNYNESVNQESRRGVPHIAMINFINKMNIMLEIREIAKAPDVSYKMSSNVVIYFHNVGGSVIITLIAPLPDMKVTLRIISLL